MADVYLSSVDGDDGDDGSTWALAKATLNAAMTAAGADGRVFMDSAHAEVQTTSQSLVSPGTAASPTRIFSVDRTGNPEPPTTLLAGGSLAVTGNNSLSFSGVAYFSGLVASCERAINLLTGSTPGALWFEDSALRCLGLGVGIVLGSNGNGTDDVVIAFRNTSVQFTLESQSIAVSQRFIWEDGSVESAGAAPTALFASRSGDPGHIVVAAVDLAHLAGSSALVDVSGLSPSDFAFCNCKLGSGVAISTGTSPGQGGSRITVVNCDSADTGYRFARHEPFTGDEVHETTIVRTGGASDGTTPVSRKIVTVATSAIYSPYRSQWIEFWNETTGSAITATVETVTDNVTLTDAEAWLEVEYLGTSGFPLGELAHDRNANLAFGTPADQTSSSETWTTTGLTTPVKQKLSVTFTPQEKGIVRCRVCVAKASTTVYYDPKVLDASGRQYQSIGGFVNEGAAGSGGGGRRRRLITVS